MKRRNFITGVLALVASAKAIAFGSEPSGKHTVEGFHYYHKFRDGIVEYGWRAKITLGSKVTY